VALFFLSELRTRKAPAVCSPPRKTCHVATCIQFADVPDQHGRVPVRDPRHRFFLLHTRNDVFSPCLFIISSQNRPLRVECCPPGRSQLSRLRTYIVQEVLSSRFCIFFQLRHMPLSIPKRVLVFGTSHATSSLLRDVSLLLPIFLSFHIFFR